MASISSLFRSHRRGTTAATPITPENNTHAWGMSALSETPTEINPGLFLDSPTDTTTQAPAFPGLREINLDSIQAPEPRTREEFLQCESQGFTSLRLLQRHITVQRFSL
ncbi:hypothetical protein CesoFtcFv8_027375 [Champsocephalus esox]|uniref:Uncharacterized protein n=1 Tax=Champsocephalus esox TaxID=159716 RepID=A0AAN7YBM6_9TELE|nr:hypothetical protein CesoFtcFv8_027375 [Champsocephalus esox]